MSNDARTPAPISRTSIYVAAARAIGAREPDLAVRNPDNLAERLLGDPLTFAVEHPAVVAVSQPYDEAMKNVEVAGIVRAMLIRTRYIDDALTRAVADGATQVVILGAGLDSHAYRCQSLLAHTSVFEVDRPATQALKMARVQAVLGGPPANLTYVPIDFQHDDLLAMMARHGHNPRRRTFFILEGVTMYMPEDSVRATLRFVGSHTAGSRIVFDFVYRPMVDWMASIDLHELPAGARSSAGRFMDLIKDEPWVFGMPVDGEEQFLAGCGLTLREVLMVGGEESLRRFVTRADGTQVGGEAVAAARAVAERTRETGDSGGVPSPQAAARLREQQRLMAQHLAEALVA